MVERLLALAVLAALAAGSVLHVLGIDGPAHAVWAASAAVALVPLAWSVVKTLARRDVGVDAIALVAIAGALALGEYLAASIIALMLSGGNALESTAGRRARRELTKLVERAPRIAHLRRGEAVEEVPVDDVHPGDVVLVRPGEVVPADGVVAAESAVIDESALTGEPLPVELHRGGTVRSGTANAGAAFDLRVTRPAAESAYAALVKLVREAERHRAPFVRLADRYAAIFLPVSLAVAGAAWAASGDAKRALAVMVVATPCPLILAAPIALISGLSRAARAGVIVKGGTAIERLGEARTVLLDKTGTVTLGTPDVDRIVALGAIPEQELLRLAASLDQLSAHTLAEALVHDAQRRGLELSFPTDSTERIGQGIEGAVNGHRVAVGSSAWLEGHGYPGAGAQARALDDGDAAGRAKVLVGVDGELAGVIVIADHVRADAADLVQQLRGAGIRHIALVTGDREEIAEEIGRQIGVDRVYSEHSPDEKLDVVRAMRDNPLLRPVIMVGDGINDAPALALADVGIAMGFAGATVSSETADAVIVVDRIDRVVDAVKIGRRSLYIARQSVLAGIGLSLVAMGFAGFGYISPVWGALLQEAIDIAVILNALRALRA